jgi:hypothetical protein
MTEFMREADVLPPFFVLALESRMRMQTIIDTLNAAALVTIPPDKPCPAATPQPPIDAVWHPRKRLGAISAVKRGTDIPHSDDRHPVSRLAWPFGRHSAGETAGVAAHDDASSAATGIRCPSLLCSRNPSGQIYERQQSGQS